MRILLYLLIALWLLSSNAFAQQRLEEEVNIIQYYSPVLENAIKIRYTPDIQKNVPAKSEMLYATQDMQYTVCANVDSVGSQELSSQANAPQPLLYAKFGGGNLSTFLSDIVFNSSQSESYQYGVRYNSYTAKGKEQYQDFASFNADIFGKYIGSDVIATGDLNFNQSNNYFYGYNPQYFSYTSADQLLHKLNNFSCIFEASNRTGNHYNVDYALQTGGYNFHDNYAAKEGNFFLNGIFNKTFGDIRSAVALNMDFTNTHSTDTTKFINNTIKLNPYVMLGQGRLTGNVGINMIAQMGTDGMFRVYPNLYAEYEALPNYVNIFGGLNGDLKKNTLSEFSKVNPFLQPGIDIQNTKENFNLFFGAKGTVTNQIGFDFQVKYTKGNKFAFFQNPVLEIAAPPISPAPVPTEIVNTQYMYVVYSGKKSSKTNLYFAFNYDISEKLHSNLSMDFNIYNLTDLDKPWQVPQTKVNWINIYQFNEKFAMTFDIFGSGKFYALTDHTTGEYQTIKGYADVNIGASYRVFKNFGAFLNFNNIFNNSYQHYLNYKSFGFNMVGGLNIII